ncbi:MAG TPA: acyl-CoA thioesterase [Flavobacteriales bacterium]|nr:acyl-CoA thioesterase [Flavobacteriales bacterium]HIA10819.1 acyl-CoA thioesterase [Flavobacteriales bacterium]
MYSTEIKIRVRYGETDRMGYVYYGNYAEYFEVARVEALRSLGLSYKDTEDKGILLPVHTYDIKFLAPAHYDDELLIKTHIIEMPRARIRFRYETLNSEGVVINIANTALVFIDKESNKPIPAPELFLIKLQPYFQTT